MSLQLLVIEGPDMGRILTLHPGDDNVLGRGKVFEDIELALAIYNDL